MAERTHIPGSAACGEWETLLADALDGLLKPEDEATFTAHKAACPACAALYEEARKGREWLEFLSPEPEAPQGCSKRFWRRQGRATRRAQDGLARRCRCPRGRRAVPAFVPPVVAAAGIFGADAFERAAAAADDGGDGVLLHRADAEHDWSAAGERAYDGVRLADLRPQAVRSYMERQLTMASVPIVRYYDHLRFVYEVESRVRELRGQGEGEGKGEQRKQTQPVTPGETRQNPGQSRNQAERGRARNGPSATVGQPGDGAGKRRGE